MTKWWKYTYRLVHTSHYSYTYIRPIFDTGGSSCVGTGGSSCGWNMSMTWWCQHLCACVLMPHLSPTIKVFVALCTCPVGTIINVHRYWAKVGKLDICTPSFYNKTFMKELKNDETVRANSYKSFKMTKWWKYTYKFL